MSRMRRWLIVGGLALAQVGIIVCYLELQAGAPARATADELSPSAEQAPAPAVPTGHCPALSPTVDVPPLPMAAPTNVAPPPDVARTPPSPLPDQPAPPGPVPVPARPAPAGFAEPEPAPPVAAKTDSLPVPTPLAATSPPQSGTPLPTPAAPPASPPLPAVTRPSIDAPTGWNSPDRPVPAAPAQPPAPKPTPVVCPWTFHLVIVDGRTLLTAKTGDEVQFKVTCDRLELQAPGGAIQAAGAIKLNSAGLEGTAERLTIKLQEDRVLLDGQAHLKASREGQQLELQADRLSLRIIDGRLSDRAEAAEPWFEP